MERLEVENLVAELKKAISKEIQKNRYENAFNIISVCAMLLYEANLYYMDEQLEDNIGDIAAHLVQQGCIGADFTPVDDTLLFFDGFGLNNRGLIQIYMNALCKIKKVIYVTFSDRKNEIPDVLRIIEQYKCKSVFIDRTTRINQIVQLDAIVKENKPGHFFLYSLPDDVLATAIMSVYDKRIKTYQINLTDHAFWLGAKHLDVCVDFRPYGAKISHEYRKIPQDKIVLVPYYPVVDLNKSFEGYPFEVKENQKVIFSGGSLYKTLGEGNKYYQIVDYILANYEEAVFWYAGSGDDSELKKIIAKYPHRAFFTNERKDLYQVIEHCYFYLSTYPVCGGLMFQYAARAGKIPVTLKHGNISDDFLIHQSGLGVEFESLDAIYEEIDHLMRDEEYTKTKSERMREAVISVQDFEREVKKLFSNEKSNYSDVIYEHIDTAAFRQIYLDEISETQVNELLARKSTTSLIKYLPIRYMKGVFSKLIQKIKCYGAN